MEVVKLVLRFFGLLFHVLLALFLLGVSGLALSTARTLDLGMLPWTGATLNWVLLLGALFGLVSIVLAVAGKWRLLFFAWSLVVAVMLVKGYVFSPYRFPPGHFSTALYLTLASWISVLGAWFQLRRTTAAERSRLR